MAAMMGGMGGMPGMGGNENLSSNKQFIFTKM